MRIIILSYIFALDVCVSESRPETFIVVGNLLVNIILYGHQSDRAEPVCVNMTASVLYRHSCMNFGPYSFVTKTIARSLDLPLL